MYGLEDDGSESCILGHFIYKVRHELALPHLVCKLCTARVTWTRMSLGLWSVQINVDADWINSAQP